MSGDHAEGVVLWAVHQVNWDDRVDFSRADLFQEMAVGPDRRLYLTESLARGAAEAEARAEAEERRRDDPEDDLSPDPTWLRLGGNDPPWATEGPGGPAGSRWEIDQWSRTYYVLAMAVQGRPIEVG